MISYRTGITANEIFNWRTTQTKQSRPIFLSDGWSISNLLQYGYFLIFVELILTQIPQDELSRTSSDSYSCTENLRIWELFYRRTFLSSMVSTKWIFLIRSRQIQYYQDVYQYFRQIRYLQDISRSFRTGNRNLLWARISYMRSTNLTDSCNDIGNKLEL